jgi:type II secretory pathway component PulC
MELNHIRLLPCNHSREITGMELEPIHPFSLHTNLGLEYGELSISHVHTPRISPWPL